MTATQDFNYKVALASGLQDLQSGRLRQAEEQFRYLVRRFPTAPGGHRGLAKVLGELDDRPGALATLREGAASLAKAGDRSGAIALLGEAVVLGPTDVTVHRHLAAALGLAADHAAAIAEHRRFVRASIDGDGREIALREIAYALASNGDDPDLLAVAVECGLSVHTVNEARRAVTLVNELAARLPAGRAGEADPPAPAPPPVGGTGESADESAARLIAAGDPRAAEAVIVAAREFMAAGHTHAASDLLLQAIASGLADHQAQRLLVEVASSIGKKDVARAKCALLADALRLDGQAELAAEVERLAQAV